MDGSVTISLRNFVGEGIISKWIKQIKRYTNVSVPLRRVILLSLSCYV